MINEIKRAVSLYSYQEEYFLKKMSLEDCIAATAKRVQRVLKYSANKV